MEDVRRQALLMRDNATREESVSSLVFGGRRLYRPTRSRRHAEDEDLMARARRRGELLDQMLALQASAESFDEVAAAFEVPPTPNIKGLDDKGLRALRMRAEARLTHSLDDVCSICCSEQRQGQRIMRLPGCGHIFHSSCLRTWLARSACCPMCRQELRPPTGAPLVHGGFRSSHALALHSYEG